MPVYEYECPTCGSTFERTQRFTDAPVQQCPSGHTGVRRVFAPAGIIFKGSGFYVTDHRKGNDAKGESKTESKSASTNE